MATKQERRTEDVNESVGNHKRSVGKQVLIAVVFFIILVVFSAILKTHLDYKAGEKIYYNILQNGYDVKVKKVSVSHDTTYSEPMVLVESVDNKGEVYVVVDSSLAEKPAGTEVVIRTDGTRAQMKYQPYFARKFI